MIAIERCPVCGGERTTVVCRYNGLILLRDAQQTDLARYDYACCHTCALVFASRRPVGGEFEYLSRNFNEFLGRPMTEDANPLDNEHPLTERDRESLRRRLDGGWLVSEEGERPKTDWMPWLLYDRMSQGYHFDWLSAALPLEGKRVLEVRSKTGFLLDMLRRYHNARVFAMPMFESQQFVIEHLYDIPCATRVDFEHFEIPYEGQFDLIISKHLFTHAIHPAEMFGTLRERLAPGGYLYLYAETDDAFKYRKGKNLFGEQKCFHFQNFDLDTFARCLRWQGFRVIFIRHPKRGDSEMTCLAQVDPEVRGVPVSPDELENRLAMYRAWHDGSALCLPDHAQAVLGEEMEAVRARERARQSDPAFRRPRRPGKAFRVMHEEGYSAVNDQRSRSSAT